SRKTKYIHLTYYITNKYTKLWMITDIHIIISFFIACLCILPRYFGGQVSFGGQLSQFSDELIGLKLEALFKPKSMTFLYMFI
ncbi:MULTISPECIES: hypothetical protein, partial [unclassified Chryseobacterium]|uniref:hypothetical protein n=1 Tax=unclassified Chryseobacterium TaxID=2593645 RepID=UPI001E61E965